METKKPNGPAAMLIVGNQPATIETAARAIVDVLKAAETEGARVAAVNALAAIAHNPANVSISNCHFESPVVARKR